MPEVPSGHVDKIEATVISSQSTQVNEVEQGNSNWMFDRLPADRVAEVKGKYEGTQYRTVPTFGTEFVWMNTTQAPFDDLKVREAVNYAINPEKIERITPANSPPPSRSSPPGMPGYKKFDLYPYDMAKAKALLKEANPADLDVTFWVDSLNEEIGENFESVLDEIGFNATLKIVNADNYFTVIGDEKTPDLDLGYASWGAEYPDPNAFFEPLLAGSSIAAAEQHQPGPDRRPGAQQEDRKLATEPPGPQQEKEYAALDKAYMEQAPWAPYGTPIASLFVSSDINFDSVIWSPIFSGDLTSFQFK